MTTPVDVTVLAHGVGGRTDLPLTAAVAVTGAVWAVIASFLILSVLWPRPRGGRDRAGLPLPSVLQRILDSQPLRDALRLLVLAASVLVAVVAFAGPAESAVNLAPFALYITFWVGLAVVSLLFGPVWRVLNPLRFLHRGLARLEGRSPDSGRRELPAAFGWWPAAAWLAVFVWLELVPPFRSEPAVVGFFLLGYAAVNLLAAHTYGATWFDRGEGFEAYSTLIGALSPFGRRVDGRLIVRNPLDGGIALRHEPGLTALVVVLIGSTAFDGLTRSRFWVEQIPPDSIMAGTLGLAGMTGAVAALYILATTMADRRTSAAPVAVVEPALQAAAAGPPVAAEAAATGASPDRSGSVPAAARVPLRAWFAASLVPIAVGYVIAHYFSLFLFEGQTTWILASDPFGTGADYLGSRDRRVDYTFVSSIAIGYIQIGAIVAGHVVAALIAHDRAVTMFGERDARRSQYPLMAVMLLFTGTAVALLVST